jgi:hypothetical protein
MTYKYELIKERNFEEQAIYKIKLCSNIVTLYFIFIIMSIFIDYLWRLIIHNIKQIYNIRINGIIIRPMKYIIYLKIIPKFIIIINEFPSKKEKILIETQEQT